MDLTRPDPTVTDRLGTAFRAEESTLRAALDRARADFDHRGVRGDAVERSMRDFLDRHLPRKLAVGNGEVIDRHGTRSNQLDVVVLNEDQPFLQERDTPGMYLIEGVSAVGEIKTSLGTSDLADILAKGKRLLSLQTVPGKGDHAYGAQGDFARFYDSLPYFAIVLQSNLKSETILEKLRAADDVETSPGVRVPTLDALFVLDIGAFFNLGDGTGSFVVGDGEGGRASGWVGPIGEGALISLFTWLNATMPRIERRTSIVLPYVLAML